MKAFVEERRKYIVVFSILVAVVLETRTARPEVQEEPFELLTARDGRIARLAEGVSVLLQADTHVRVKQASKVLRVEIVEGGCSFEIDPKSEAVLEVVTNGVLVSDGSARFDVMRERHSTRVRIVEGDAMVARRPTELDPLRLKAGDEAIFTAESLSGPASNAIDLHVRRMARTAGRLSFERAPLREVIEQLNKFNTRQLIIGKMELGDLRMSGVFPANDLDTFLRALLPFGIEVIERDPQEGGPVVMLMTVAR